MERFSHQPDNNNKGMSVKRHFLEVREEARDKLRANGLYPQEGGERTASNLPHRPEPIKPFTNAELQRYVQVAQHDAAQQRALETTFSSRIQNNWEDSNRPMDISDIKENKKILETQISRVKALHTRYYNGEETPTSLMHKHASEQLTHFVNHLDDRTQHDWNQMIESTNESLRQACQRIEGHIKFEKATQRSQS